MVNSMNAAWVQIKYQLKFCLNTKTLYPQGRIWNKSVLMKNSMSEFVHISFPFFPRNLLVLMWESIKKTPAKWRLDRLTLWTQQTMMNNSSKE